MGSVARSLRHASRAELRRRIVEGFAVDPAALEGFAYRGTALGLPRVAELITWKTFQKTFWRHASSGRLLGWNVRLEQDGVDAPSRPMRRRGEPVTEWNYEVISPHGPSPRPGGGPRAPVPMPPGFDRGLVIDYSLAPNPLLATVRLVKDPLVALTEGDYDELLGVSYLVLGGQTLETPTYFTLERDHHVDFVPRELRS
jgi:hypothetical protein